MAYIPPMPADLKARFPDFTAVADATVQYWLTDAERIVTGEWLERDYAVGLMTLAAHEMASAGIGAPASAIPAGVTSFKSASFSATISDAVAGATGYDSTRYGKAFRLLLRRNAGGPRLVGCVVPSACC